MTHQVNSGGRYEVDKKTGERKLVEEPTKMPAPGEPAGNAAGDLKPAKSPKNGA